MIDNGAEMDTDGAWMQNPGYMMSLRQVPARPAVETSNRFTAFTSEDADEPPPPEPIEPRAEKPTALLGISRKCCGSKSNQCQHGSGPGFRTLIEKRTQSLRPLESKWEKFNAILDSGASVTVVPPHIGHCGRAL